MSPERFRGRRRHDWDLARRGKPSKKVQETDFHGREALPDLPDASARRDFRLGFPWAGEICLAGGEISKWEFVGGEISSWNKIIILIFFQEEISPARRSTLLGF